MPKHREWYIFGNALWIAFSIPSGSLSLVKYPVVINHFKISKKKFGIQRYSISGTYGLIKFFGRK
jgi:hypothetical protein